MTLLSIKDYSLSLGGQTILSKVTLSVEPGEIVAVTGESGSGKSMLALSVMGLLPDGAQTSGQIDLAGLHP